ncbi:MAG: Ig-like domain-containing protein [Solirubrobacterales bacterium]|nr:Ig-like domain-containing protein [Solirubrobacterales bacterium]
MNPAGLLNRTSSLAPGTTGFAQTTAAASGDFIYVTNDQAQQLVLRLSDGQPVAGGEFAPYAAAVAAPNTGVGQPSISRGFVQFSGGTGAFVYRNADLTAPAVALTAPADGATVGGLVTLTATASDARGLLGVTFLLDGAVVGLDTVADSGSPFAATGATYSVQVDTTRLRAGGAVIEAVAEDTARQAASSRRRIVIANTPTPTPRRVAPAVSFTVTPARDVRGPRRFTVRGQIAVPAGVRRADACRGRVTVRYKARTRTISTRRVSVTRACTFSARTTFRVSGRFAGARTLAVRVRFAGNRVLLPRQARSRVVRVR